MALIYTFFAVVAASAPYYSASHGNSLGSGVASLFLELTGNCQALQFVTQQKVLQASFMGGYGPMDFNLSEVPTNTNRYHVQTLNLLPTLLLSMTNEDETSLDRYEMWHRILISVDLRAMSVSQIFRFLT
jgi:hypothetical protein